MNEYENRRPRRFLRLLIIVGLVLLAAYLIWNNGHVKSKVSSLTKDDSQEVAADQSAVTTPIYD